MIRQSARTGRTLSTSSIQREVIQAQGHSGSNQNCTLSFASGCSVTPAQNSHSGKGIPTGTVRIGAEAFGFRKVIDATFMIGFLVTGRDVGKADVDKYLAALRRARWRSISTPSSTSIITSVRCRRSTGNRWTCGPSAPANASSFSPYTREVFVATRDWTEANKIFPGQPRSRAAYDEAVLA